MAQEKARPTRARTTKAGEAAAKAGRKPRTKKRMPQPSSEEIATLAYLMWERGEPGDATDHWFRAEQELVA
jgi:hypothetical protein